MTTATIATILVVEDEVSLRDLISLLLRDAGYATISAGNGAEALVLLNREPVHLVLMDIMMPVLDGRETIRRIRAQPALRHLPVVLMSAADPPTLDANASGFLAKPFLRTELLDVVSAGLESSS